MQQFTGMDCVSLYRCHATALQTRSCSKEEFVDTPISMRSVSYQRKAGQFLPDFLLPIPFHYDTSAVCSAFASSVMEQCPSYSLRIRGGAPYVPFNNSLGRNSFVTPTGVGVFICKCVSALCK
jgi:hypothetical protein